MQGLCGSLLYGLLEKASLQRWWLLPSAVKFLCGQKFSKMCLGHKTSDIIVESWINMSITINFRSICHETTRFIIFISLCTWNPAWQELSTKKKKHFLKNKIPEELKSSKDSPPPSPFSAAWLWLKLQIILTLYLKLFLKRTWESCKKIYFQFCLSIPLLPCWVAQRFELCHWKNVTKTFCVMIYCSSLQLMWKLSMAWHENFYVDWLLCEVLCTSVTWKIMMWEWQLWRQAGLLVLLTHEGCITGSWFW